MPNEKERNELAPNLERLASMETLLDEVRRDLELTPEEVARLDRTCFLDAGVPNG